MPTVPTIALCVFLFLAAYHWPELVAFSRNRARRKRRQDASRRANVLPIERQPRLGRMAPEDY